MNADRLLELADAIDALDNQRFNMATFLDVIDTDSLLEEGESVPICGTVCCIAGHAVAISAPDDFARCLVVKDGTIDDNGIYIMAKYLLDLTYTQADQLFLTRRLDGHEIIFGNIKRRHAVTALRQMAMHGVIYWDQIIDET